MEKMKALLNHHDAEINAGYVILVFPWVGDSKGGVFFEDTTSTFTN
ncbi:hypothetical protein C5167_031709 [Papaver somniferum]|uniref:Uncharacterized protein n=1 Tax=Papaver somniferum TaxID=3469 RepID=A0A4Y7K845_PAPSO|nr:hypothetical protein C5167_031709 [Papaver somniferum]